MPGQHEKRGSGGRRDSSQLLQSILLESSRYKKQDRTSLEQLLNDRIYATHESYLQEVIQHNTNMDVPRYDLSYQYLRSGGVIPTPLSHPPAETREGYRISLPTLGRLRISLSREVNSVETGLRF